MKLARLIVAAVLLSSAATVAGQQRYGNWAVSVSDSDTVIASTLNDSGQWFGKVCWVSTQKCVWAISVSDTCRAGNEYIGLVNSNTGAQEMNFACTGEVKEGQLLVVQEYEKMQTISANDPSIGIALAMQNGAFKVLRFSLNGSHEASAAAETLVTSAGSNSTRDLTL